MTWQVRDLSTSAPVSASQTTKVLEYTFEPPASVQDLEAMAKDALGEFEGIATSWRSAEVAGSQVITVSGPKAPVMVA